MAVVFPYVKNPTWADGSGGGTAIDAADLNKIEDGIFNIHQAPAARVRRTTNQVITTGTITALGFDAERFDQAGGAAAAHHDNATNNPRLTCLYAGVYLIGATIDWENVDAGSFRQTLFRLNGTTVIADDVRTQDTASIIRQTPSTLYALAVNDYVECMVSHDRGSNLNVLASANYSPEFWMVRVA